MMMTLGRERVGEGVRPSLLNSAFPPMSQSVPLAETEGTARLPSPARPHRFRHAPPVTIGNSRQSGDGVTDADAKTGRADHNDRMHTRPADCEPGIKR